MTDSKPLPATRARRVRVARRASEGTAPDAWPALDREAAVRARAYELYVARGNAPGSPLDDWLSAERELLHPTAHPRPTGPPPTGRAP